jgi:hypothetical protein
MKRSMVFFRMGSTNWSLLGYWVCILVGVALVNTTAPLRKSDRFDKDHITRCARIQKVKNTGRNLELVLEIKTGGMYHEGCIEDLTLAYIPPPGYEIDIQDHAGERCVSKMGTSLKFKEGGVVYDSELNCQQIGHQSHSGFTPDPIILEVNFDSPVYERTLELHHVAHRGDPHADSIPFVSGAFKANANFVNPGFFDEEHPNVMNYDNVFNRPNPVYSPEEPMCTQFTFPGGPAYIPNDTALMDKRKVAEIYSPHSGLEPYTIAVFPHNFELVDDVFSIGSDTISTGISHDAAYQMNWKKPPPLSPFIMTTISDLITAMQKLQMTSQVHGGGFVFPRDWYNYRAIEEQGFGQVQTYISLLSLVGRDGACGVSFEILSKTIAILGSIRDLLGYDKLSDIAGLAQEMGISHYDLLNLEEHLKSILNRLAVFVKTTKVTMPALISLLDRINGSPLTGMHADATISTSCDYSNRLSPLTCISSKQWKSIFGVNPVNGYTPSVSDLVSALSSTWEPVLCSAFPNSTQGEKCLSVNQWSCGKYRQNLKRQVITNQQSHNPSCKIWKPVKKSLGEAIVSGTIKSIKAGFSMEFSQSRIKDRVAKHSSTFREIIDPIKFINTFDLSKSGGTGMGTGQYSRTISAALQTKYGSLSLNQHLMEPSSAFYILQCGDLYSHRDYDGYPVTENPYTRYCTNDNITKRFFPYTNESRGCTPLDLDSQKNFLFLSKAHAQKGVLGTGCGAMNFNTGETGGSFLRQVQTRYGNKNLNTIGLDANDGYSKEELSTYLTTPHLCSPGQSCVLTSPCRMYGEMVAWGGHVGGTVAQIDKAHAIEVAIINANPQERECYYGEDGGVVISLPPVVTELDFSLSELTRSSYRPYEFLRNNPLRPSVNPNFDPVRINSGELSPKFMRDYINSITANKQFCSGANGVGAGYPEVLSAIMNPFTESLYHPIAWIYAPETSFTDGARHHGDTHTLRSMGHGRPLAVHYINGATSPAPSPSPSTSPEATPFPSPSPSPTPTPTPTPTTQRVDRKQTVHHHHLFYKHHLDGIGQFASEAVSFEAHISIPLPRSTREIQIVSNKKNLIHSRSALYAANTAACISVETATNVWTRFPYVQEATLLPLMGTVAYDSTLDNMYPPGTPIPLFLTILCLPFTVNRICYDVDASNSFVLDSCHFPKQISVTQRYIPKALAESLLAETMASAARGGIGGRDSFGPITSSIISRGRMIHVNWTQTQSPDDIFRWVVGLQRQRTTPSGDVETEFHFNGIKSPLFHTFLSVGSPEVIVSQYQPVYGADDIQIIRLIDKNSERVPEDPGTCIYDSVFCKGFVREMELPPTPPPTNVFPVPVSSPIPSPTPTPIPFTFTPIPSPNPLPTPTPGNSNSSGGNSTDCDSSIHDIGCDFHNGTIKSNAWFWVFFVIALIVALVLGYYIIKCFRQREANKVKGSKKREANASKKNK